LGRGARASIIDAARAVEHLHGTPACEPVVQALWIEESVRRPELLENFFSSVVEEGIRPSRANLRFYLDFLFDSVALEGNSVLDIGGGDGTLGFYARCAGAKQVVCLEPEEAGSSAGMTETFRRMQARLGLSEVRFESKTFQAFDPRGETFDVILLHNSLNHLDEEACIALQRDPAARARIG
jgi:2-polyprenyl-3-methyl-5-hydroxy-6-metoxy-1,4-benzoquinol methylase